MDLVQVTLPYSEKLPFINSGRAVRMRVLSRSERDAIILLAAQLADKNAEKATLIRWAEGVKKSLVACTKKGGLVPTVSLSVNGEPPVVNDPAYDPATEWMPLDAQMLQDQYDKLFTTADDEILVAWYRTLHEPAPKVVEDILGKARMVSSG